MELEQGKDYKTYFMDTKVSCFYARKLYWKPIEVWTVDGCQTFLPDEEERFRAYVENSKYNRWGYYQNIIPPEEIKDELTEEQKTILRENTQKVTVKCEFYKRAICCPACHKVHRLEDFLVIKPEKKSMIEQIEAAFGKDWYCLFDYNRHSNASLFFESIYEDFDGYDLDKYKETHPEACAYPKQNAFSVYYWGGGKLCNFYPKLICPECGCLINDYNMKILSIFNKFDENNSKLNAITIFNDQKKIAVSALFRCYYINVDALTIARDEYRIRLTFNTVTGQTYFVGPKKLNGKRMSGWHDHFLVNLTYRRAGYPPTPARILLNNFLVKREVMKLLSERNKDTIDKFKIFPALPDEENFNESMDILSFDDIDFNKVPLTWVTLYNRFPCLTGEQIKNLYPESYQNDYVSNYFMKDLFKGVKRNFSANELLETVMKNCKVPRNKKLKKLLINNLLYAKNILAFIKVGFKDINLIQRFLELPSSQQEAFESNINYEGTNYTRIFVRDMIAKKGEPKTFNTLFNNNPRCDNICDAARMYVKFKESDMVLNEYFTDSIKKIHDRMSRDYPKIQFKNVKIEYPKKSERYNMTISNEYEFNLAEDTNELVRIGQELKICVGGYRDSALSGSCRIISMKQNGKYVGCIELSSDFKRLLQAKAVCNNLLQEFKAQALKSWVESLCIDASNCYDYQHIKSNQIEYEETAIYSSNHDYHHYEIDENGEVVGRQYRNVDNNIPDDDEEELPFG